MEIFLKDYLEEELHFTKEEINFFCKIANDNNPEHNINLDRVLVPGLLISAKAFGATHNVTYLRETQMKFKEKIFLDEKIVVRRRIINQKKTKIGLFQHLGIQVFANEKLKYDMNIKILKVN